MNIEEAIDTLKEHKKLIDKKYLKAKNSKAIETVLNELEKKYKVIDEMAKDILHDRNEWVEFDFEKYKDIEEVKEEYYKKVSDN